MSDQKRKRERITLLYSARKILGERVFERTHREQWSWFFLLKWASLGGRPDEVIGS